MADLALGSHGPAVEALQQALAAAGYVVGAVDGRFGARTDAAVRYFQSVSGLPVDGVVGGSTSTALGLSTDHAPAAQLVMPEPGTRATSTYTVQVHCPAPTTVTMYLDFDVDGKTYTSSPQDAEVHPDAGRLVVFDVPPEARQHSGEITVDAFVFLSAGGGAIAQGTSTIITND